MSWTQAERSEILAQAREISISLTGANAKEKSIEDLARLDEMEETLLEEYAENLPYFSISRCPFCNEVLEIAFDPYGLDGPWWWATCPVMLPAHQACEHFRVFLGAMDLAGRQPVEATEGVILGPGAPFVIDRLLEIESMKAVISQKTTTAGYIAYFISYFSEAPVDQMELHQEWRKESYPIYDEDGTIVGAESKFDPWNFELRPWIEQGKLLWITPEDENLELHIDTPTPYEGLKATHKRQIVSSGSVELWAPPEGQESSKFETA